MSHPRIRIALTDSRLLASLRGLDPAPEYLLCGAESLHSHLGKVDLFVLDDATALRFLGARPEKSWPSVVVVASEGEPVPSAYRQGLADELLVLPARALDLERLFRSHEVFGALRSLEESSRGVTDLVRQLQEDISLAQKIQRRLIREKFPPLGPLSVKSKYWCGLKSGGDYFDLFEFPGGAHAGLIFSDCSSYSLSTSLIGSLMQFSVHVGQGDPDPQAIVQTLFGKLRESMKESDRLSLFYGVLDRKTYALRYVACGAVFAAKRGRDGKIQWGPKGEQAPLALDHPRVPELRELSLEPGDQLLLCSDGWGEALGASQPRWMEELLSSGKDSQELLNEMAFRLRRELEKAGEEPATAEDDFPMPPQDCSALLFDLAANVLRLAR